MAKLLTYSEAQTRFANLATTGISIGDAIQEAVDTIYEMGRWPGTTRELPLTDGMFSFDADSNEYTITFDETIYDGVVGFRNRQRGWAIVDQASLFKDGINSGDLEFVDLGTVGGDSVDAVAASITVNPDGADNSIIFTALETGPSGNSISVEIAEPDGDALEVSVFGTAITIQPSRILHYATATVTVDEGSISNEEVTIDGVTYSVVVPDPEVYSTVFDSAAGLAALINGTAEWAGDPHPTVSATVDGEVVTLTARTAGAVGNSITLSETGSGLVVSGFSGGSDEIDISTAAEVIDAVNAHAGASALVVASASGADTGEVAAVEAVFLAGGVSGGITSNYRKYRCPLDWSLDGGPYYALVKLEAPTLSENTLIPVESMKALKCAIQAVCYEYVSDEDRANLCWQKFEMFMGRSVRQVSGPKRWTLGMDSSLRRKPRQFF